MDSKKKIKIGGKLVGEGEPIFIIAEAGSNHNGSLELAKKLIDVAAEAGTDAVKFQAFKADKLFNKVKNKDIVDKLEKLELREEWYKELFDYADKKGLIFLSTLPAVFMRNLWGDIQLSRLYMRPYTKPAKGLLPER